MTEQEKPVADGRRDEEHLRLLSICHFVVAGFTGLFSLFPVIHLVIGGMLLTGGIDVPDEEAGMAFFMGSFFVVLALTFIVAGLALAVAIAAAGVFLRRRERYTFCLVVAGLSCMLMPFGTVLGILTIVVLMREPVKALFGQTG
jgi:hypothetical protein